MSGSDHAAQCDYVIIYNAAESGRHMTTSQPRNLFDVVLILGKPRATLSPNFV